MNCCSQREAILRTLAVTLISAIVVACSEAERPKAIELSESLSTELNELKSLLSPGQYAVLSVGQARWLDYRENYCSSFLERSGDDPKTATECRVELDQARLAELWRYRRSVSNVATQRTSALSFGNTDAPPAETTTAPDRPPPRPARQRTPAAVTSPDEATNMQLPDISPQATVHAVGVYQGALPDGQRRGFQQHPMGTVDVEVGGSGPVVLVLTAYEPVRWRVRSAGARIEQILMYGYYAQEVEGASSYTQVYNSPRGSSGGATFAYQRDGRFRALASTVRELTGKEITTFQGSYEGAKFMIAAAPGRSSMNSGSAVHIRRWVDEHGVVHFEDARLNP